jgi:DNA (cytosine-5)-methyltransferase 1
VLVLSLFPGIGLLDMAFEEEGFCIVRGPDPIWGGDIRRFRAEAGHFAGVIGGPPCQVFSELAALVRANGHEPTFGNLIPEFERIVDESQPAWFVMENVRGAPEPAVPAYHVESRLLNNRWFGAEQNRERRFSFGTRDGVPIARYLEFATIEDRAWSPAVTGDMRVATNGARVRNKQNREGKSSGGVCPHVGKLASFGEMLRLQGLPDDFLRHAPLTSSGKRKAVGNGVPLPMGRAVARAVKRAFQAEEMAA